MNQVLWVYLTNDEKERKEVEEFTEYCNYRFIVNKREGMEVDEKDIVNIGLVVKERRRYM